MLEDVFQMLGISLPAFTSGDESELYELIARIRKIVPGRTLLDYLEYSSSKQMLKQSIHEGLELARRMR